MKILITGDQGFIAKNLKLFLKSRPDITIFTFSKKNKTSDLNDIVKKVDFIFHLAGVNRSQNLEEFAIGNENLSKQLCDTIKKTGRKIPFIYSSSIQADLDNPYGVSKKNVENIFFNFRKEYQNPFYIFRLPNVFGKWCKPNYNSVVATFCYNIIRDIPVNINNSDDLIDLVYIDASHWYNDVINDINCWLPKIKSGGYLSGHDYVPNVDVTKAVNGCFKSTHAITIYPDSSWVIKKS